MAEYQVITEFIADTSGLKSAADQMLALGQISKKQYDEFTRANQQAEQAAKKALAVEQALSKATQQTTGDAKKMNDTFRQLTTVIAGEVLKETVTALAEVGTEIQQVEAKAKTAKQELRELNNAINSGQLEGEALQTATLRAAELTDQIGDARDTVNRLASDTRTFDLVAEGVRGITAAFSVAQAGAALFGKENEDLQRALLKVQAAMALATGAQELANIATAKGGIATTAYNFALQVVDKTQKALAVSSAVAWGAVTAGIGLAVAAVAAFVAYVSDAGSETGKFSEQQAAEEKKNVEAQEQMRKDIYERIRQQDAEFRKDLDRQRKDYQILGLDSTTAEYNELSRIIETYQGRLESYARGEQVVELTAEREKEIQDIIRDATLLRLEIQRKADEERLKRAADLAAKLQEIEDAELLARLKRRVAIAKDGSLEELKAREELAYAESNINLRKLGNDKTTAERRKLIYVQTEQQIAEIRKEYINKNIEAEINADIALKEARLANAKANSEEALQAQIELLDAQYTAKRFALAKDVQNEAEYQSKLYALNTEATNAKLQLQLTYYEQLKTARQSDLDAEKAHALAMAQLELGGPGSGAQAAHQLKLKQYDIEDARLNEQMQLLDDKYNEESKLVSDTTELYKQYQKDRQAIDDAIALNAQAKAKETYDYEKALEDQKRTAAIELARQTADAIFAITANIADAQLQDELQKLNKSRDLELQNKALTEQQKQAINERYAREEAALKRKAYEQDKASKLAQAAINGALAITNILATRPKSDFGVGDAILIASAIASTAAQIGIIASTPIPAFKKGGKNIPAGMKLVGEEGPELIYTPGGETVIPHGDTKKILEAWSIPMPNIPAALLSDTAIGPAMPVIDYSQMAAAFAGELRKNPMLNVKLDRSGYSIYIHSKNKSVNLLNNTYDA